MDPRKRNGAPARREPRGARKVAVPFPDAWADAWDSYEYTKLAEGQSPNSVRTRRSSVLRLAKAYPDRAPEQITRRDIERHITAMQKTLKPATVFAAFHDMRGFFEWLAKDIRTANIMEGMTRKTPAMADVPVLSEAQLKALIGTCKGEGIIALRDKAIILMFLETGIRRMELQGLRLSDVSLRESTCYIRRGKGGRPRVAIFGPATADALRRYLRAVKVTRERHWGELDSPLFLSRYGVALGYGGVAVMLKSRGDAAGIVGMRPHLLRHSWCHYSLDGGVGDSNVITLAGWTSGRQLARYGRALAVQRAAAAARANPVGNILRKRQP
jgi:integrase/recombinase XerC